MTKKNSHKIYSIDDVFEWRFEWPVHRAGYRIETQKGLGYNYLIPDNAGAGTRTIWPFSESELLLEAFASISPDDYDSIISFVNIYGPLEAMTKTPPLEKNFACISRIQSEVCLIRTLLDTWDAAQEESPDFSLEHLKYFLVPQEVSRDTGKSDFYVTLSLPSQIPPMDKERGILLDGSHDDIDSLKKKNLLSMSQANFVGCARLLVLQSLNDQLRRCPSISQIFIDNAKMRPILRLVPQDLISAIWSQFLQYVTEERDIDGRKIVRCMFCGKHGFFNRDWRQGGENEKYKGQCYHIKCQNRTRQREYRKDKKK
jgi:hypothetical protein